VDTSKAKHAPVTAGECTACHSPHQTTLARLVLAKTPDLCLGCHKTLQASMSEGRVHSPAARDCLRCHTPHASAEGRLMVQPVGALCASCHDTAAVAFDDAHLQIAPANMRCERCHDPHASKDPKFFKSNAHAPFASKECQECHLPSRARTK
jgi:predicted CXXCH cytochrome family protein